MLAAKKVVLKSQCDKNQFSDANEGAIGDIFHTQ